MFANNFCFLIFEFSLLNEAFWVIFKHCVLLRRNINLHSFLGPFRHIVKSLVSRVDKRHFGQQNMVETTGFGSKTTLEHETFLMVACQYNFSPNGHTLLNIYLCVLFMAVID